MENIPHTQLLDLAFKEAIKQKQFMIIKYKWLAGSEKDRPTKHLWQDILSDHQRYISTLQEKKQKLNLP